MERNGTKDIKVEGFETEQLTVAHKKVDFEEASWCKRNINVGWCCSCFAGLLFIGFIVAVFLVPYNFHPVSYSDNRSRPLIKQGRIDVIPGFVGHYVGEFFVPRARETAVNRIRDFLSKYNVDREVNYTNCWTEYPEKDKPCSFDARWLTAAGCSTDDFGYQVVKNTFSPCFLLTFNDTESWAPMLFENPHGVKWPHDSSFLKIACSIQSSLKSNASITMHPNKGVSSLYFPASKFNHQTYLPPALMVKVSNIEYNANTTIRCDVLALNTHFLEDSGTVIIHLNH